MAAAMVTTVPGISPPTIPRTFPHGWGGGLPHPRPQSSRAVRQQLYHNEEAGPFEVHPAVSPLCLGGPSSLSFVFLPIPGQACQDLGLNQGAGVFVSVSKYRGTSGLW